MWIFSTKGLANAMDEYDRLDLSVADETETFMSTL